MQIKIEVSNLKKGSVKKIHDQLEDKFDPDDSGFGEDKGTFHMTFIAMDAFETIALLVDLFFNNLINHYSISINWADGD